MFKQISTNKQWSCKFPTNQAALYALQMTQLVQNFHSNSIQILIQYISTHDWALNASTNNSTNNSTTNCSKKYQLTKPWSCKTSTIQAALYLLQITQLEEHFHSKSMQILSQYICAWLRSQSINYNSTNNCSKKCQLAKPWPCKSTTTQAALYLQQMTQLVRHFHSNSMQILSQYICAW